MTTKQIKVLRTTWLDGPSIWTYKPAIETLLNIQAFEQYPSNLLPGFNERLIALLPGLYEHQCGVGKPGGFIERLQDGTYAAHILEHITIELHNQIGQPVKFGKARMTSQEAEYKMVFHTTDRQVGLHCFQTALRLFEACVENLPFDLPAELDKLKAVAARHAVSPSTQQIIDAARKRRIPVLRINNSNLIQLGQGARQQQIWGSETSKTSAIADGIASDEELTRSLLRMCGVPTADEDEVQALELAAKAGEQGRFYRLLTMKGQLVAACQLNTAGLPADVTAQVHPDIARNVALASKLADLNIAGIDLVCADITQGMDQQEVKVLRLACRPDLTLHAGTQHADGRSVADLIIDSLFEEGEQGRIPVISYSGGAESNGLGQAIHALLTMGGFKTGLSSAKYLNLVDYRVDQGLHARWYEGRRCLISKQVDAAVMRVEPEQILAEGLPFDRSSVAVITSLGSHQGLEAWDINEPAKYFNVMRTVVDVVLDSGCAVLNADEVGLLPLAELCDGEVIWFADSADNGILQDHFRQGGRGVYLRGGMIHYQKGMESPTPLIAMSSFDGLLSAQGAMAAVASAWALNLSPELIHASLAFYLEKGWAKNPSNQRVNI